MSFVELSADVETFDTYGPLIAAGNVADAVLSQLRSQNPDGLRYYVAAVERRNGINPRTLPQPNTFRRGLDFETWQGDETPIIIAVCQPTGNPESQGGDDFCQDFEVQVGAVVEAGSEADAIALADCYGIALTGCLTQHGSLLGFAERTKLAQFPATQFLREDGPRNIVRSVAGFHVYVQSVVAGRYSPIPLPAGTPPPDPYRRPADYPEVESTDVVFKATAP